MSIYQEIILDHYHNPRNSGTPLENPTGTITLDNPLCGDQLTLDIRVEQGRVTAVSYRAVGCAISIAAASMLSEYITGKTVGEVQAMTKDTILELLQISLTPNRLKCALLSLEAVQKIV